MAMINQLTRRDGRPTPYFVVQPPGLLPHAMAHLQLDYRYPCGPHCRGLTVAPWQGTAAAAVAPMIELDLYGQLALDVSTLIHPALLENFEPFPETLASWQNSPLNHTRSYTLARGPNGGVFTMVSETYTVYFLSGALSLPKPLS